MKVSKALYVMAVCLAVFGASLAGTIFARSQIQSESEKYGDSPIARWLDLDKTTADEIEDHDLSFRDDLKSSQTALADARKALAALLEDSGASSDSIRKQVESCISAHNALERRVTDYLLTVRDHLTAEQQKKLFRLCAEGVRKGRGYGWGRSGGGGRGFCEHCGRGGGGGRGRHKAADDASGTVQGAGAGDDKILADPPDAD